MINIGFHPSTIGESRNQVSEFGRYHHLEKEKALEF